MSYKSNEKFVKFVKEINYCGFKVSLLDLRLIELKIYESIITQIIAKLTEYNDINKDLINKGLLVDEVFYTITSSNKQEKTDLQKLDLYKVIAIYINNTLEDYIKVIKIALNRSETD